MINVTKIYFLPFEEYFQNKKIWKNEWLICG